MPGWAAKGHPGYWGYAWYRIRVHLQERPGEKLALAGPSDVDDAYQVFDNGELVGSFGDFTASTPVVYYTQPMMFALSQPAGGNPGSSTRVLAFRVWMHPNTLAGQPDVGGFHTAPVLGEAGAVAASYQIRWLELVRTYAFGAVQALLFALLAAMAFSLTLFDRSDRVYLWMGAVFLAEAAAAAELPFAVWTQHLSTTVDRLFASLSRSAYIRGMGDDLVGLVPAATAGLATTRRGRANRGLHRRGSHWRRPVL